MNVDECVWQWAMCPHAWSGKNMHCPLYIESHETRKLGCVDDLARPCKVERGEMDFQQQCRRLAREANPTQAVVVSIKPEGRA